jgi:hypothetical protein
MRYSIKRTGRKGVKAGNMKEMISLKFQQAILLAVNNTTKFITYFLSDNIYWNTFTGIVPGNCF